MVKRWVVAGIIILFVSACADPKLQKQYYDVELQRTQAIIDSINAQSANQQQSMTLAMQSYSSSISAAALTDSPGDDVAIAMAWGFMLGRPQNITTPNLPPIQKPETNSDMIRAWTPLIGMALPFLYPLVWGSGNSGSGGNSYNAESGGSIVLDSGNPGSYNTVGGDYRFDALQEDWAVVNAGSDVSNDCPGCEDSFDVCEVFPDGLACAGCSCGSLAAGECECP